MFRRNGIHRLNVERAKRLIREGGWVLLGQVLVVTGSLVGVRLMTELLTPAAYGELALGMTGASGAARHLPPFLLDADAFTRLCASEGLRHLLKRDWEVDWMYGESEERFRTAEELWTWMLANDR